MFIRTKTTPNSPRKSVQIVSAYRVGTRIKQRIVRHIGVAEDAEQLRQLKELATLALVEIERSGQIGLLSAEEEARQIIAAKEAAEEAAAVQAEIAAAAPLPVDLRQLREQTRVTVGIHEVYGRVYAQLGFDRLLGARRAASARILRDTVLARIARPLSKLGSAHMLERDFGLEINTDQMYRMMDHLDEPTLLRMQGAARTAAQSLLGEAFDVLFFDCTTLYFESFEEDELRQKGFSKDHKSAETQVLLALLVTREGLPVGYRLYPGAQWEGDTLRQAVADVQALCAVRRIVLVADAGLFNKKNLDMLAALQQPYIVAARLKGMSQALQNQILDRSAYQPLRAVAADPDGSGVTWRELEYEGQRLLVTHSPLRARKDAQERNKTIARAKKRYDGKTAKSLLGSGSARYLKLEGGSRMVLDAERIAQAARWDGLHGLLTNIPDLSPEQAIDQYRGLWQVEETFRLSKHDLAIRPVFHWSERRIRAHVGLCFMALTCIRWLTHTCAVRYERLSAEVIRNELMHVQASIVEDQNSQRRYVIPSRPTKHARQLYKLVGRRLSAVPFEINGTYPVMSKM